MTRKTVASLPLWEQATCWVVGVSGILYGIYRLHLASIERTSSLKYIYEGWDFIGEIKDAADYEWAMVSSYMVWRVLPMVVLHSITSLLLAHLSVSTTVRKLVYLTVGLSATLYVQSWRLLALYTLTAVAFFMVSALHSVPAVWVLALITTSICNAQILVVDVLNATTIEEYFTVIYVWASVFVRCTFYSIERVWSLRTQTATSSLSSTKPSLAAAEVVPDATAETPKVVNGTKSSLADTETSLHLTRKRALTSSKRETFMSSSSLGKHNASRAEQSLYDWSVMPEVPDFLDCFAYVFYVPLLFNGPPLSFKSFKTQIENPRSVPTSECVNIAWKLFKVCLLFCFNNVLLHLFYFSAFGQNPASIENVDAWTVITTAYMIGQFMANKYMFMYGAMTQVARLDGLKLADPPACISYIYTYSDMWRSFDRGLHHCLKRYIHTPLKRSQLMRSAQARTQLALLVTFCSLGYWHGGRYNYMMWALLNFLEMGLETMGSALEGCQLVQKHLVSRLSAAGMRRVRAVFVYPLFIVGTTSNMFFLAGTSFAHFYLSTICLRWDCFLTFGLVVYCMTQNAKHLEQLGLARCPVTDHGAL